MRTARRDAMPESQLAFDLPHVEASGRDDFLISDANRAALAAIDRWPDWPNPVLVLTGPAGCGKLWRSGGATAAKPSACTATVERVPALLERGTLVVEDAAPTSGRCSSHQPGARDQGMCRSPAGMTRRGARAARPSASGRPVAAIGGAG
jgi:hypothetical protein